MTKDGQIEFLRGQVLQVAADRMRAHEFIRGLIGKEHVAPASVRMNQIVREVREYLATHDRGGE